MSIKAKDPKLVSLIGEFMKVYLPCVRNRDDDTVASYRYSKTTIAISPVLGAVTLAPRGVLGNIHTDNRKEAWQLGRVILI